MQKGANLNRLFEQFGNLGIHIASMRNRANRLEELFVSLVGQQLEEVTP